MLDPLFDQRLFNREQAGYDVVVILNDQLLLNDLLSKSFAFGVNILGSLRDLEVQLFEILHLSQESDQGGVEVDPQLSVVVFGEEGLVELFLALLDDLPLPDQFLLLLVVLD